MGKNTTTRTGKRELRVIVRDWLPEDFEAREDTVKVFIEARYFCDYAFPNEDDETVIVISQEMHEQDVLRYLVDQGKNNVWFYIDPTAVPDVETHFRRIFEAYANSPAKPKELAYA